MRRSCARIGPSGAIAGRAKAGNRISFAAPGHSSAFSGDIQRSIPPDREVLRAHGQSGGCDFANSTVPAPFGRPDRKVFDADREVLDAHGGNTGVRWGGAGRG